MLGADNRLQILRIVLLNLVWHLRHPVWEVPTLPKLPSLVPRSGSEGAEASISTAGQDFSAAGAARIAINGAEMDHLKYRHRSMLMPALPVWKNIWGI